MKDIFLPCYTYLSRSFTKTGVAEEGRQITCLRFIAPLDSTFFAEVLFMSPTQTFRINDNSSRLLWKYTKLTAVASPREIFHLSSPSIPLFSSFPYTYTSSTLIIKLLRLFRSTPTAIQLFSFCFSSFPPYTIPRLLASCIPT